MDETPDTVTVEALEAHSYNGVDYQVGDIYDVPVDLLDTLRVQGKAVRADRVQDAKRQEKAAKKSSESKKNG